MFIPRTLDELFRAMRANHPDLGEWTSLPTFGGHEPLNTMEIWSWDEDRVIVGTCDDDIRIENREDVNIDTHGHTAADTQLLTWRNQL